MSQINLIVISVIVRIVIFGAVLFFDACRFGTTTFLEQNGDTDDASEEYNAD